MQPSLWSWSSDCGGQPNDRHYQHQWQQMTAIMWHQWQHFTTIHQWQHHQWQLLLTTKGNVCHHWLVFILLNSNKLSQILQLLSNFISEMTRVSKACWIAKQGPTREWRLWIIIPHDSSLKLLRNINNSIKSLQTCMILVLVTQQLPICLSIEL